MTVLTGHPFRTPRAGRADGHGRRRWAATGDEHPDRHADNQRYEPRRQPTRRVTRTLLRTRAHVTSRATLSAATNRMLFILGSPKQCQCQLVNGPTRTMTGSHSRPKRPGCRSVRAVPVERCFSSPATRTVGSQATSRWNRRARPRCVFAGPPNTRLTRPGHRHRGVSPRVSTTPGRRLCVRPGHARWQARRGSRPSVPTRGCDTVRRFRAVGR
jgi:hypothetical protein